jgi:Meckel syndrome type 1 protein
MNRTIVAVLAVACGLLVGACDKKEEPKPGAAATGGGASIGVKECDDYLAKMEKCIGAVPAAGKPAMEQGLKASRDSWATLAKDPTTKATLPASCKAALDALSANPACK